MTIHPPTFAKAPYGDVIADAHGVSLTQDGPGALSIHIEGQRLPIQGVSPRALLRLARRIDPKAIQPREV